VGRIAAYAGAIALTPYAVIKASWVIGSLVGLLPVGEGFTMPSWVALNTLTVVMAFVGIAASLSLVRPWGMRVPGRPLAFFVWVGAGFLVPTLPFLVISPLFQSADYSAAKNDDPVMPAWEAVLMQIGFLGMALGLALGLPAYLRRRWPDAFSLRLDDAAGRRGRRTRLAATLAATGVGLFLLSWAAGSTAGVAHPAERDVSWHLLQGIPGVWALILVLALTMLRRGIPAGLPRWIPVSAAAWIGSGTLFAWGGWKLGITLFLLIARPDGTVMPENLGVAAVLHAVCFVTGATLALALARSVAGSDGTAPAEAEQPSPAMA